MWVLSYSTSMLRKLGGRGTSFRIVLVVYKHLQKTSNWAQIMVLGFERLENFVRKGEIPSYRHFPFSHVVFEGLHVEPCSMKMAESLKKKKKTCRKHYGKGELLVTSIFSFPHSVFKTHLQKTCKSQGLFGKGLKSEETTITGFQSSGEMDN